MGNFTFNELLAQRGVTNLKHCRIVRHDTRGLRAWQHLRAHLEHFFGYQRLGNRSPYHKARTVFQFVPVGRSGALFVGGDTVEDAWAFPEDPRQHDAFDPAFGENDDHPHMRYNLRRLPAFEDLVGRVLIEWGDGTRAWSQWPARQDKAILELRAQPQELPFPGFAAFHSSVEDVPYLPQAWIGALGSVGGVYLLVCPETGAQYVGSAYGEDGFAGRWRSYAETGHGGNALLKGHARVNYAVSILEIASPHMSAKDIILRESAWKARLGSRAHGLNAN